MQTVLIVLAAYALGSVSFAIVLSRLFAMPDPRSYGSGNPGATNVLRTGRKLVAALTLLGDGGKGWLAVWAASLAEPTAIYYAGIAVFLGGLAAAGAFADDVAWWALLVALVFTLASGLDYAWQAPTLLRGRQPA